MRHGEERRRTFPSRRNGRKKDQVTSGFSSSVLCPHSERGLGDKQIGQQEWAEPINLIGVDPRYQSVRRSSEGKEPRFCLLPGAKAAPSRCIFVLPNWSKPPTKTPILRFRGLLRDTGIVSAVVCTIPYNQ